MKLYQHVLFGIHWLMGTLLIGIGIVGVLGIVWSDWKNFVGVLVGVTIAWLGTIFVCDAKTLL